MMTEERGRLVYATGCRYSHNERRQRKRLTLGIGKCILEHLELVSVWQFLKSLIRCDLLHQSMEIGERDEGEGERKEVSIRY